MALPMTTTQAATTGTGIFVILAGAAEVCRQFGEAMADDRLSITEASGLLATALLVIASLRMRRAIG